MKHSLILLLGILLVLGLNCKSENIKSKKQDSDNKEPTTKKEKGDIVGETYNFGDQTDRGAIAFGLATNEGYTLPTNIDGQYNYVKPQEIEKLPNKFSIKSRGKMESVEELPSSSEYYNGSKNLNVIEVDCKLFVESNCLNHSSCGWCGSSSNCIRGNSIGPLEPCVKSSFIHSAPQPNWSSQERIINKTPVGVQISSVVLS